MVKTALRLQDFLAEVKRPSSLHHDPSQHPGTSLDEALHTLMLTLVHDLYSEDSSNANNAQRMSANLDSILVELEVFKRKLEALARG